MSSAQDHNQSEDGVPSYLNRLTKCRLLSAEEEVTLTRAIQAGDEGARSRLIESNMRLVINIAKSYHNRQIPMEDLIQEGAIGLIQAAERFDPERGFRFSTYATHWIRQAISRAIDGKAKPIRLPAHIVQSVRRFERARDEFCSKTGHEPSEEELAQYLGLSVSRLTFILRASQEVISLDANMNENGNSSLINIVKDSESAESDSPAVDEKLLAELKIIMAYLTEREKKIIQLKLQSPHPYDDQEENNEIAREMKLSCERLRQIEIQAIKKLRAIAASRRTKDISTKNLHFHT